MLIYDGPLNVDYRQFSVVSDWDTDTTRQSTRLGQSQGLCGAAIAGHLDLVTATHAGLVTLRVEQLDVEPPDAEGYEDVVEVSFHPRGERAWVQEWQGDVLAELAVEPRWYRARYSCAGFEAAYGNEVQDGPDSPPKGSDRYLLQLWPESSARPDELVRVSGEHAAGFHARARQEQPRGREFRSWVE